MPQVRSDNELRVNYLVEKQFEALIKNSERALIR